MNPQFLKRKKKKDNERMSRFFSRIAVIPFKEVQKKKTLENCLQLREEVRPVIEEAIRSVGVVLELRNAYEEMRGDDLFKSVCQSLQDVDIDMRSKMNYAMVLYSSGKILEKVQLYEKYYHLLETCVLHEVIPNHVSLVGKPNRKQFDVEDIREEMLALLSDVVKASTLEPAKAKNFFVPKAHIVKCGCGDVFGFIVPEALNAVKAQGKEQQLKDFVIKTTPHIGCVARLTIPGKGQLSGCIHIKRSVIDADLMTRMDAAFSQLKKKVPTNPEQMERVVQADTTVTATTAIGGTATKPDMPTNPEQMERVVQAATTVTATTAIGGTATKPDKEDQEGEKQRAVLKTEASSGRKRSNMTTVSKWE